MSISEELNKIIASKEAIRQSIIAKGTDVDTNVPFSDYASKIDEIETGGEYKLPEFYEMRTDNETNLRGLCYGASGDSLDLTDVDPNKSADMSYMFAECSIKNIDISTWGEINYASNISYMFNNFAGNIDITNLLFTSADSAEYMFASANLDGIKGLQTKNPVPNTINYTRMFNNAVITGELDLSAWNVDKATNMYFMFDSISCERLNLSNWKTTNVTNMSYMFGSSRGPSELIIPDWDMTNVTNASNLFGYSSMYTTNLRYIDLSRSNNATVSQIANLLHAKTESNYGDIKIPDDTSQEVIDVLTAKYWRPIGVKLDLISCEIASELDEVLLGNTTKICVGNCNPWYGDTENNFEFVVANDSVASIDKDGVLTTHSLGSTEIYAILKDSKAIISNTITVSVVEAYSNPNEFKFKTDNNADPVQYQINGILLSASNCSFDSISQVWTYCDGNIITQAKTASYKPNNILEVIKLDTSNMTDMGSMFYCSKKLISVNTTDWNTSNVTKMTDAFRDCELLTSLDASSWDTSKAIVMNSTFFGCYNLVSIKGDLDLSNYQNASIMFEGCYELEEVSLVNILKDATVPGFAVNISLRLEDTKIKDECLISIISELPNLYDKGVTNNTNIILGLPPTNTLTAEQVQPAIDKGWIVTNVNPNVIDEASTFSLRKPVIPDRVYKLEENENGLYQSQDGTRYDILEANIVLSSEGINVGWDAYKDLNQAIEGFNVIRIEVPIEPEEETVTNNEEEIARCENEIEALQDTIVQLQARIDELQNK